jgi:hypothetical protein
MKGLVLFLFLTLGAMFCNFAPSLCFSDTIKNHQEIKENGKSSLPPAYLFVPNFKSCLGTKKSKTAYFYCLPKEKKRKCPKSSWKKLKPMHLNPCT